MNCVIYDAFLYGLVSGTAHLNNIDEFCLVPMDRAYKIGEDKTSLEIKWSTDLSDKRAKSGISLVEPKEVNLIADIQDDEEGHKFLIQSDDNIIWENLSCQIGSLVLYNRTADIPIAYYSLDKVLTLKEMDFILKSPMTLLEFTV